MSPEVATTTCQEATLEMLHPSNTIVHYSQGMRVHHKVCRIACVVGAAVGREHESEHLLKTKKKRIAGNRFEEGYA